MAQRPKSLQTVGETIEAKSRRKTKSKDFDRATDKPMDSPPYVSHLPTLPSVLKLSQFDEGEIRGFLDLESWTTPRVQTLVQSILHWMNDVLASDRIVLRDLVEDLYDGLIIKRLLERLTNADVSYSFVPLSSKKERLKELGDVLKKCADLLGPASLWDSIRWTPEAVSSKNAVVIIQMAVALAAFFRAPLPILIDRSIQNRCRVRVLIVERRDEKLYAKDAVDDLIPNLGGMVLDPGVGSQLERRDAFDTLFDHAPEKLDAVTKSALAFANEHLNKLNIYVTGLDQFQDGVYLILLMGSLENYFIALYEYHVTPISYEQKLKNVTYAFGLMEEAGLPKPKCRPDDIVLGDAKCILRTLFALYNRYQRV